MATMKDIIQSPLLLALFGSMALGLFASSASGSKGSRAASRACCRFWSS